MIQNQISKTNKALREDLYRGDVFLTEATEASKKLIDLVHEVLHRELGNEPRRAERLLGPEEFFVCMGKIRKEIYTQQRFHRAVRSCISALGFDNDFVAFDPARLRIINHDGHHNPLAAAVYYPHRDTWYGHPSSLITWWIPLDDLSAEETFWFYPEKFDCAVPNSSLIFDYDEWVSKGWDFRIGWQKVSHHHRLEYPGVIGSPDRGSPVPFSCTKAQNLLFSGAHFHATRPQSFGRTRYSLDFRIVDMRDVQSGRGAPSVDDQSRGSAVEDYIQPGKIEW
jgi:hypothetical protein